ncbi:MAG: enoyl-CoA hydratase/isomerase family protein [Deltaproteobacteria bacterium]|nr:enoyl-CoA hydratase/isomerase family protein [Deltaproteobacteria bacterium]
MYQTIRYEVSEGIATIRFDRPEKLNAYTVVILTGEGRAFCAGVDLDYYKAQMAGESPSKGSKLGEEAFVRSWPLDLIQYPKPVIAAINGAAYGVGVTMTLGCDVRIAARSAVLGLNFTRLGMLPGLGSTHHLPRLVGIGKASELLLSGAKLSAEEAHEIGLVQRRQALGRRGTRDRTRAAIGGRRCAHRRSAYTRARHGRDTPRSVGSCKTGFAPRCRGVARGRHAGRAAPER